MVIGSDSSLTWWDWSRRHNSTPNFFLILIFYSTRNSKEGSNQDRPQGPRQEGRLQEGHQESRRQEARCQEGKEGKEGRRPQEVIRFLDWI